MVEPVHSTYYIGSGGTTGDLQDQVVMGLETAVQSLNSIVQLHFEKTLEKKRAVDAQKQELWRLFLLFFLFLALVLSGLGQTGRIQCRHVWTPLGLLSLAHLAFYAAVAHHLRCINGYVELFGELNFEINGYSCKMRNIFHIFMYASLQHIITKEQAKKKNYQRTSLQSETLIYLEREKHEKEYNFWLVSFYAKMESRVHMYLLYFFILIFNNLIFRICQWCGLHRFTFLKYKNTFKPKKANRYKESHFLAEAIGEFFTYQQIRINFFMII